MLTASDLRIRIYIRSMTAAFGIDAVKKSINQCIKELEEELKTDPELMTPKKFDLTPKELRRRNKAAKL